MDRILLVDDDKSILEINEDYLKIKGYDVLTAETGREALSVFSVFDPSCVVLDIKLPDISGYDLCVEMKKKKEIPIIFLSCLEEEGNRISGFIMGGDDYVVKPFSMAELEWRIRARLRALHKEKNNRNIVLNGLSINTDNMTAYYNGNKIDLTFKELDILIMMMQGNGKIFSQEEIFKSVWNQDDNGDVRTVQVHIGRLRNKLMKAAGYNILKTVWGKGYRLDIN